MKLAIVANGVSRPASSSIMPSTPEKGSRE
jgi:hypothetical protein